MPALNERGDINAASIGIYLILTIILGFIFRNNGICQSIGLLFVFLFTFGERTPRKSDCAMEKLNIGNS